MKNKKIAILISVLLVCAMSIAAFTACDKNAEKSINVIGRDSASGTREAFESLIKNSDGTKLEGGGTRSHFGGNREGSVQQNGNRLHIARLS
mgnify:CR=1 FL=1